MSPTWADVNARARGLTTRLVSRALMERFAACDDLAMLADEMRGAGFDLPEGGGAPALELAARRTAAAHFAILLRWFGARAAVLAVVIEEEECRSLRALLRGAVQGAPADQRMAGLFPTPSLPEKALAELAGQPTIAALATLLVAWRHPYGEPLRAEARGPHPDLLTLETVLSRTCAARALRAARRAGRRGPLIDFVRLVIDLENAQTALAITGADPGLAPKDLFVPGGDRVSIEAFELALATETIELAAESLERRFDGTPVADALGEGVRDPAGLEIGLLRARIAILAPKRRNDPLGPSTVLLYFLELRLQLVELRRIIWGLALSQAPAATTP